MNPLCGIYYVVEHNVLPCPQNTPPARALNDSGCPLGDNDLFDTGLGDEEEEEEESLEAIRAAVKQRMKKHKVEKSLGVFLLVFFFFAFCFFSVTYIIYLDF